MNMNLSQRFVLVLAAIHNVVSAQAPTTVLVTVTPTFTTTVVKTIVDHRGTSFTYTTPKPKSAPASVYAAPNLVTGVPKVSTQNFKRIPSAKVSLDNLNQNRPLDQITSTITAPPITSTITSSKSLYSYAPRVRTIASQCASSVPIYNGALYDNDCHDGSIQAYFYTYPVNDTDIIYDFDARSCCDACLNTLDCVQGIVTPKENKCVLVLHTDGSSLGGISSALDSCSLNRTPVRFGEILATEAGDRSYWDGVGGTIRGSCAADCSGNKFRKE